MVTIELDGKEYEVDALTSQDDASSAVVANNDSGVPDATILAFVQNGRGQQLAEYLDDISDVHKDIIKALFDESLELEDIANGIDEIRIYDDVDDWFDKNEDWIMDGVPEKMYNIFVNALDSQKVFDATDGNGMVVTLGNGTIVDYSAIR